jgi:hypothetical protein
LAAVKGYHHKLCTTRALDPACGTGNFLYVSLELMKRLEGEVLEALDDLGEDQARFAMEVKNAHCGVTIGADRDPTPIGFFSISLWRYCRHLQRSDPCADLPPTSFRHFGFRLARCATNSTQRRQG